MIKKYISKYHFRHLRKQLKGVRVLRKKGEPYFVNNLLSELTNIPLDLKPSDFHESLVGDHAGNAEVLLRQIFLNRSYKLSSAIMATFGSGSSLKFILPPTWIRHIRKKGISVSTKISLVCIYLLAFKNILYGFSKLFFLLSHKGVSDNFNLPYVVFLGLKQDNLPDSKASRKYDIISWFRKSGIEQNENIQIWAQCKIPKKYNPPDNLIVSRFIFPKFKNSKQYVYFFLKSINGLIISVFGVLRGKWWYGVLFSESVNLYYVMALGGQHIAKGYYFNNSGWFLKPLWTYEAEKYESKCILYYYSTNIENYQYNHQKQVKKVIYGLKIMTWKNFVVWDQEQEDYLRQFCPNSNYIQVKYLDFSGKEFLHKKSSGKKRLAVFDVTPTRLTHYLKLGVAEPHYYSEELNLAFLQDIINIFPQDEWDILWKRKRLVGYTFCSKGFINKQNDLVSSKLNIIESSVAARALVESSDAVISMPFTSTAILGKIKGVPSIYYDALGHAQQTEVHGIEILACKEDLSNWRKIISCEETSQK